MVKNYENTKIYKIVCNVSGLIYIGATTKKYLSQRLDAHISSFKSFKAGKNTRETTSYKVLEAGDYYIELLELCNCSNIEEQSVKERYYVDLIDCVNKYIPGRTTKEYLQDNKNKIKEYKIRNQEKIDEYQKEYKIKNKEKIKQNFKEYQIKNREKLRLKLNEYNRINRDIINKKQRERKAKLSLESDIEFTNNELDYLLEDL